MIDFLLDGKIICSISIEEQGVSLEEIHETRKLLAYEKNVQLEQIKLDIR